MKYDLKNQEEFQNFLDRISAIKNPDLNELFCSINSVYKFLKEYKNKDLILNPI